jgi:hypothetical protein
MHAVYLLADVSAGSQKHGYPRAGHPRVADGLGYPLSHDEQVCRDRRLEFRQEARGLNRDDKRVTCVDGPKVHNRSNPLAFGLITKRLAPA